MKVISLFKYAQNPLDNGQHLVIKNNELAVDKSQNSELIGLCRKTRLVNLMQE